MKFKINNQIFTKFPGLNIGVVIAKSINNFGFIEEVQNETRKLEVEIRARFSTETLSQNPKINVWRKAYTAFGAKPKEHRSSVENLYRLVLQGVNLRHINKLVDIYNLISLKHFLPVGGEDIDKMHGDLVLDFAVANEPPILLLGDKESRPPHLGEVIYKDEISAVCRRWNWREAERTKLTEETKSCLLVIEGLPPVTKAEVEVATEELKELVERYCEGQVWCDMLDGNKVEI